MTYDFRLTIPLPRSKSIVIRCLIIHYLRTGELLPVFDDDPNDIKVVYKALKTINGRDVVRNVPLLTPVNVQDCGAAYRFLMAVLAATHGKWLLTGTPRLLERPILPLVNFLNENGAKITKAESGWYIEGKDLIIEKFDLDSAETSQYVSAVMLITCKRCLDKFFTAKDTKKSQRTQKVKCINSNLCDFCEKSLRPLRLKFLTTERTLTISPYIKMTQILLQTPLTANRPPQTAHRKPLTYSDWSAATFWIAKALLIPNAHYLLKNLHFDNLQGDTAIVSWFEKWGVTFTETPQGIEVCHTHQVDIPAQTIDVAQTPDIAMILAVLAVCYPFQLTLSGLKNINLKESNRLDIMVNELSKFTKIEQLHPRRP